MELKIKVLAGLVPAGGPKGEFLPPLLQHSLVVCGQLPLVVHSLAGGHIAPVFASEVTLPSPHLYLISASLLQG